MYLNYPNTTLNVLTTSLDGLSKFVFETLLYGQSFKLQYFRSSSVGSVAFFGRWLSIVDDIIDPVIFADVHIWHVV